MEKVILPPRKDEYAYGCDDCGELAFWKDCFRPYEDRGTYIPGKGYSSYFPKPRKCCRTRLLKGCPGDTFVYAEDGTLKELLLPPNKDKLQPYFQYMLDKLKMTVRVKKFITSLTKLVLGLLEDRKELVKTNNILKVKLNEIIPGH